MRRCVTAAAKPRDYPPWPLHGRGSRTLPVRSAGRRHRGLARYTLRYRGAVLRPRLNYRSRGIQTGNQVPTLVVQRPGRPDENIDLDTEEFSIGRLSANNLTVDDQSVSRHHAVIATSGDGHTVRDLQSRNGSWLNGERIGDTPMPLQHGDEIQLGRLAVVLRFLAEEDTVPEGIALGSLTSRMPGLTAAWSYRGRGLRFIKMTPWLRFTAAILGAIGALLSLVWWIFKLAS